MTALRAALAGGGPASARSRGDAGTPVSSTRLLDTHTRDMLLEAAQGRYDPAAGREAELDRVIQILLRRSKNNPVLLGDPGVGKTALVEALAQRMALGLAPDALREQRLLMLDLGSLVAGTKYRGEFEDRMKKLLREVARAGNVILFLDELHILLGAGGAEGAIGGSDLLKPALARGELRMIGATTGEEFRRLVEKDPALERRFQPVRVEEPSPDQAREILEVLLPRYSRHHGLRFQPKALDAAVSLSVRYLPDRRLPDKAIDLLDEAAARRRLELDRREEGVRVLEERIARAHRDRAAALADWDRERALRCQAAGEDFREALEARRRTLALTGPGEVTATDVARVVSQWTGIPAASLTRPEREKLLGLEAALRRRVTGQDAAVSAVARAVRRSRAGLKEPGRPAGAFLFLGPTGVGKTELCKALAEALFGREEALLRFDMTEFSQPHTASRLIGAPPGYVGHESGGQLTDAVRAHPWSVVLFDELEKAHPDVWGLLLQIMEDGILTDAHGRKADFRNAVLVMTSNVGGTGLSAGAPLGFAAGAEGGEAALRRELREIFRPEFLGRLDEVVVFRPLERSHMEAITKKLLNGVSRRLEENGVGFLPSSRAIALLAERGTDRRYGARPLRRLIRAQVEEPAAELLLRQAVSPGGTLYLDAAAEELVLSPLC